MGTLCFKERTKARETSSRGRVRRRTGGQQRRVCVMVDECSRGGWEEGMTTGKKIRVMGKLKRRR